MVVQRRRFVPVAVADHGVRTVGIGRVSDSDRANAKQYQTFRGVSEHALRLTSQAWSPWIVVEGSDRRYRELVTGRTLLTAIRERLKEMGGPDARSCSRPRQME